jgi:hypothetical protein
LSDEDWIDFVFANCPVLALTTFMAVSPKGVDCGAISLHSESTLPAQTGPSVLSSGNAAVDELAEDLPSTPLAVFQQFACLQLGVSELTGHDSSDTADGRAQPRDSFLALPE